MRALTHDQMNRLGGRGGSTKAFVFTIVATIKGENSAGVPARISMILQEPATGVTGSRRFAYSVEHPSPYTAISTFMAKASLSTGTSPTCLRCRAQGSEIGVDKSRPCRLQTAAGSPAAERAAGFRNSRSAA